MSKYQIVFIVWTPMAFVVRLYLVDLLKHRYYAIWGGNNATAPGNGANLQLLIGVRWPQRLHAKYITTLLFHREKMSYIGMVTVCWPRWLKFLASPWSQIMAQHNLTDGRDQRSSLMMKPNGDLNTIMLYRALKNEHSTPDAWAKFIWQSKAPPRVKFFAWLLSQGKIQCKTTLMKKNIVDNTICETCQALEGTAAHFLFNLIII